MAIQPIKVPDAKPLHSIANAKMRLDDSRQLAATLLEVIEALKVLEANQKLIAEKLK